MSTTFQFALHQSICVHDVHKGGIAGIQLIVQAGGHKQWHSRIKSSYVGQSKRFQIACYVVGHLSAQGEANYVYIRVARVHQSLHKLCSTSTRLTCIVYGAYVTRTWRQHTPVYIEDVVVILGEVLCGGRDWKGIIIM